MFSSENVFILCFCSYEGMEGEPDTPEYRVPVEDDNKDVILRVELARNVVVRSLVFIRTSVLENKEFNFKEVTKLFYDRRRSELFAATI